MRRIGSTGAVKKADYRDWPLFRQAREDKQFSAAFEEVFQEPLETIKLEVNEPPTADQTETVN